MTKYIAKCGVVEKEFDRYSDAEWYARYLESMYGIWGKVIEKTV